MLLQIIDMTKLKLINKDPSCRPLQLINFTITKLKSTGKGITAEKLSTYLGKHLRPYQKPLGLSIRTLGRNLTTQIFKMKIPYNGEKTNLSINLTPVLTMNYTAFRDGQPSSSLQTYLIRMYNQHTLMLSKVPATKIIIYLLESQLLQTTQSWSRTTLLPRR